MSQNACTIHCHHPLFVLWYLLVLLLSILSMFIFKSFSPLMMYYQNSSATNSRILNPVAHFLSDILWPLGLYPMVVLVQPLLFHYSPAKWGHNQHIIFQQYHQYNAHQVLHSSCDDIHGRHAMTASTKTLRSGIIIAKLKKSWEQQAKNNVSSLKVW